VSSVPPRVVVVGSPDDERTGRASRLAREFRVPHLAFEDATGPFDSDQGYVIDGFPDSVDRLQGLLALPTDLVVHLRPPGGDPDSEPARVLAYYEARGVVVGFPPDADDEDIIIAVEAAVRMRSRAGTVTHLLL
jgi:hypothetical protein